MSEQGKSPATWTDPVSGRSLKASDNIRECFDRGELSRYGKPFRRSVVIDLEAAGVLTFEDLSKLTDLELAKIPGCGFTHSTWLQLALKERGIDLDWSRG